MNKEERIQTARDMIQDHLDEIDDALVERKFMKASRDLDALRNWFGELEKELELE